MSLRKPKKSASAYVRHGKAPYQYSDALHNWRRAYIAGMPQDRLDQLRGAHNAYIGRMAAAAPSPLVHNAPEGL